ncbi:cytochrome C biogenesis protein CcdA [Nocardioides phosphati]|uniref:Cytochrome C biogenesis protein CcdA n=1 Tax=Nocardioides phosphati TaxID=1867775 RepID=A0ABQ2N767_9ACTN|nr:cytochrome c biogenesis protein CcdA [Nocardioides phosphati]GGO84970.1 cytochrome C biogenesis protein CcdA [Nocardioides phosphati]
MIALSADSAVAYGPLLAALPVAILAGVVSFASPCCLPLVPGYLAYVSGAAGADAVAIPTGRRAPARSTAVIGTGLFVLGFAAVFTSYGLLFGALGSTLIRHQDVITRVLGVVTIVLGLSFAGALGRISFLARTFRPAYRPRVGVLGAPLLGVMFGIGWTPCIGPTLAAVLTLATTQGTAGRGAVLAFAYSLGIGIPFLLAALGVERAFRTFAFARRHARLVMQVGGALLVVLGALEVSGLWGAWLAALRTTIGTWQTPL